MEGEACEQQGHVIRVAGAQAVLPIVGYLMLLISIYLKCCSEDICTPVVQEPAERGVRVRVKLDLRSTQSTSVSDIITYHHYQHESLSGFWPQAPTLERL